MIANAAFLAGVSVFLLLAWLAGELVFLSPYKATLFRNHGWFLGGVALVVVAVEQCLWRPAVQHEGELPGGVLRVGHSGVQATGAERRDQVRAVAGEQHPPGPHPVGVAGLELVHRLPNDVIRPVAKAVTTTLNVATAAARHMHGHSVILVMADPEANGLLLPDARATPRSRTWPCSPRQTGPTR